MDQTPGTPEEDPTPTPRGPTSGPDAPFWAAPPPPGWQPALPPLFPRSADFPVPPPEPTPPERRAGHRLGRAALVVGAAAGLAVGAMALASAATSPAGVHAADTAASSGNPSTAPTPGPDVHGFGPFGGGRFGGPGGPLLYGQFTVQGPNGFETLAERSGTVSEITNTSGTTWSLTVKSADNTTGTFVVDSGTSVNGGEMGIASVKQNDTVRVLALVSGGTSTAKQVTDETVLKANGNSWVPRPPEPPQQPGSDGSSGQSQTSTTPQ